MVLMEQQLVEAGLTKMRADQFILGPFDVGTVKEQWEFRNVVLEIFEHVHNTYYAFFDKGSPQIQMNCRNYLHFKQIVTHVSQGATINDLIWTEQNRRKEIHERMIELQKNPPYLENFRYNDIGGSFFELPSISAQKVFMTYEKHSRSAFYFSLNDIEDLERATDTVHIGAQTHSAISFWFLALESYINSLVKICCIKKNKSFEDFKKQDLHTRLGSLVSLFDLDKKEFNQKNIIAKVNEFASFRNDLFHDRHVGDELKFKHTCFSPIPIFSCQVDIMQAILIYLEVASRLRFAIEGLDTMPSVVLKNKDVAVWEKLDVAYEKILQPWFEAVLKKHQLRTHLDFVFTNSQHLYSKEFQKGDVECRIRVDQDVEFEYWLNQEPTQIGRDLYAQHLNGYNLPVGTMLLSKVDLNAG